MKRFRYVSYGGPEDFIFIRCHKKDHKKALTLANRLVEDRIRVFFDCADDPSEHLPEEVSGGILNAKLCVFFICKEALEDLDFRNSINFALGSKMPTVCIKENDMEMGHGMDMQLANIRMFRNSEELYQFVTSDPLYKDCYGEGQPLADNDEGKKRLTFIILGIVLIMTVISAFLIKNRIEYYQSAEYLLSRISESEYLDFTSFSQDDLVYLRGKKIVHLNCQDMDLKDVEALREVEIDEIDISGNTHIDTAPLCENKTLKKVMISQDMIGIGDILLDSGKIVVVTR